MSIKTLQLGQSVDSLIADTNSNFEFLTDTLAEWEETIAEGGTKAIVFSNTAKMISCLNANTTEDGVELKLNIGDEIYIVEETAPDFWVVGKVDNLSIGSAPSSWAENTTYTFGYYQIRTSKSKEINLENYVTAEELEEELANAGGGLVDDVQVNGASVVVNKIAYINIDEIQSDYIEIPTTKWGTHTLADGTTYVALELEDTDTTFELLNHNQESVVFQTARNNGNLYLCVSSQPTATWYIRKIKGDAITTGGSKKYLHAIRLKTQGQGEEDNDDGSVEEPILGTFRLVLTATAFYINNSPNPITELTDLGSTRAFVGDVHRYKFDENYDTLDNEYCLVTELSMAQSGVGVSFNCSGYILTPTTKLIQGAWYDENDQYYEERFNVVTDISIKRLSKSFSHNFTAISITDTVTEL